MESGGYKDRGHGGAERRNYHKMLNVYWLDNKDGFKGTDTHHNPSTMAHFKLYIPLPICQRMLMSQEPPNAQ